MRCHIGSFYFLKPPSLRRLETDLTTPHEYHASFRSQANEGGWMRRGDVIWNGNEWRQAWNIALVRINGAPPSVSEQIAFRHAIDMLDSAFVKGDAFEFQLGLITILDCCSSAVQRGQCTQWWGDQS